MGLRVINKNNNKIRKEVKLGAIVVRGAGVRGMQQWMEMINIYCTNEQDFQRIEIL